MKPIKEILEGVSAERIENHIKNLEGVRHPRMAPEALEKAADYIWHTLQSCGHEMTAHTFLEDGQEYRNIIATQAGTQLPEDKIVVLAHFDTVPNSPGANDNASGVAAVLELARVLKSFKFKKSIQFIGVNLEERKAESEKNSPFRRGSLALARCAREAGWTIEAVINFEEIAYAGESVAQSGPENLPFEMPEVGNFIAVVGNEDSKVLVETYIKAIQEHNIPLPCQAMVVPGNGEVFPDSRRSDHASFWDNGFPAIMLTDTANFRTPHYHKPSDTLETLNLPFAANVCRATGCMVCELAVREG